jgi:hypothetical protein
MAKKHGARFRAEASETFADPPRVMSTGTGPTGSRVKTDHREHQLGRQVRGVLRQVFLPPGVCVHSGVILARVDHYPVVPSTDFSECTVE